MNKTKIMICVLTFLLVLVPVFQVKASISVAFIYSTDLTSAESYESLLTAQGMTVDLVPSSDAATWDYSGYGLIIIGSETGSGYLWEPEAAVSVIDGTGKPILALGRGGSSFFSVLGLYIDWGHGWTGSRNSIYVVDVDHQIFHAPNEVTIPSDRIIGLYGSTGHIGIYMPSPVAGVTPLGREATDLNHYPLIQQDDRYVLWGFTNSPEDMTQTGKDLFVNVVSWLAPHNPDASFTYSPESPEYDETVTFDASASSDSDGTIASYSWDFDDGSTGTGKTTTHSYDSVGNYGVTLTVTDNDGLTDTDTKNVFVIATGVVLTPPEASFTCSPETQTINEPIDFDASGSSDTDGTIQTYSWDFGDGNTGTGSTTSHSYGSTGNYGVTLTVTDNDEQTDTALKEVIIISSGQEDITPPVASAGNDMNVKAGSKVTFSAAGSSDNVGVVSYEWDFGDGTTGTGLTSTHTYGKEGNYTVSLTVTDAAGNSNAVTIVITVEEAAADEFPYWIIILIILVIVAAVVIWYFLKKRKPKEKVPKPVKLRITAEPTEILADGKTKSAITVELLDKEGKPVPALANTEIKLITTKGKIEKPVVKIPRGKELEKTLLVSPKEAGTATLSAKVENLESTNITVTFMEKKRYCMLCGAKVPFTSKRCPECGKSPPAGVDTKACKNCNSVIPVVAKFCAECGASQPEQGARQ
jgi:PKD repeat protein